MVEKSATTHLSFATGPVHETLAHAGATRITYFLLVSEIPSFFTLLSATKNRLIVTAARHRSLLHSIF
jgi:membrane-bound metal-dependent hydrolase YbcI (DUF457 family)